MRDKLTGILRSPAELVTLGIAAAVVAATVATAGGSQSPESSAVTAQGQRVGADHEITGARVHGRSSARASLPTETTTARDARRTSAPAATDHGTAPEASDGTPLGSATELGILLRMPSATTSSSHPGGGAFTPGSTTTRTVTPPAPPTSDPGGPTTPPPVTTPPVTTPPVTTPPVTTPPPTTEPGGGFEGETTPSPSPTIESAPAPQVPPTGGAPSSPPGPEASSQG